MRRLAPSGRWPSGGGNGRTRRGGANTAPTPNCGQDLVFPRCIVREVAVGSIVIPAQVQQAVDRVEQQFVPRGNLRAAGLAARLGDADDDLAGRHAAAASWSSSNVEHVGRAAMSMNCSCSSAMRRSPTRATESSRARAQDRVRAHQAACGGRRRARGPAAGDLDRARCSAAAMVRSNRAGIASSTRSRGRVGCGWSARERSSRGHARWRCRRSTGTRSGRGKCPAAS